MPLIWTDPIYQALYRAYTTDGTRTVSYGREFADAFWRKPVHEVFSARLQALSARGVLTGAAVAVVGAGFGFLCEQLKDAGVGTVVGIDGSPYIAARLGAEKRADVTIVPATVGVDALAPILAAAGAPTRNYDFVVDEDAVSSQSDSELPAFYSACESLLKGNQRARIIHLVTPGPGGDTAINWKSLQEWKATKPDHTWIDIRTGEVA